MRSLPLSSSAFDSGRTAEAHLAADLAGGRTVLRRQHVGYPFHVTRGFRLDAARPELLTLYLQSASGGLYAGDRLKLDVNVGASAAFHLTTQAATVVHHGGDAGSSQQQRVTVGAGAFCAITSDPYVLFPGADLALDTLATVTEGAVLFLADGFAVHDPQQSGRPFGSFSGRLRVMRPDGRLLLFDRGCIRGDGGPDCAAATMAGCRSADGGRRSIRLPVRRDGGAERGGYRDADPGARWWSARPRPRGRVSRRRTCGAGF
jgi:urease accessory protein